MRSSKPIKRSDAPATLGHERFEAIWTAVAAIPFGKVATYGQIAEHAGLPRRARLVGQALRQLPSDADIPWYRVINARGEISFPSGSDAYRRQMTLLLAEKVEFKGSRIDLSRFQWTDAAIGSLDELLWKP